MAWVTPRIWSIGQLVTAADLNEQVRDNFIFLKSLVNDDGKIPAISSTYFATLDGTNLTGVVHLHTANTITDGVQNFNGGSTVRLIIPVGVNKWAAP
jgi:hypothetical protein